MDPQTDLYLREAEFQRWAVAFDGRMDRIDNFIAEQAKQGARIAVLEDRATQTEQKATQAQTRSGTISTVVAAIVSGTMTFIFGRMGA